MEDVETGDVARRSDEGKPGGLGVGEEEGEGTSSSGREVFRGVCRGQVLGEE